MVKFRVITKPREIKIEAFSLLPKDMGSKKFANKDISNRELGLLLIYLEPNLIREYMQGVSMAELARRYAPRHKFLKSRSALDLVKKGLEKYFGGTEYKHLARAKKERPNKRTNPRRLGEKRQPISYDLPRLLVVIGGELTLASEREYIEALCFEGFTRKQIAEKANSKWHRGREWLHVNNLISRGRVKRKKEQ